ncbi:DUF1853 family protein [Halopseudomonas phragmitis]|nr:MULTISPECIES: DUF1853 family protein [Pseudomonadaceae]RHW20929.1 DUF1853 domain-containing protein [Pseudomonas jilinensis]
MIEQLRHPVVRDLAWVALSAPLLGPGALPLRDPLDGSIWRSEPMRLHQALVQLERQPQRLDDVFANARDRRLGSYYERLWHMLLELAPDVRLLGHNITLHRQGRTLGELDLLLETPNGEVLHLELAIKFFLGYPQGVDTSLSSSPASAWWGPDPQDRLDRKLNHMLTHQLPLGVQLDLSDSAWPRVERSCAWLQGCLFYPAAQPMPRMIHATDTPQTHLWCHVHQASERLPADSHWSPLAHKAWLMPPSSPSVVLSPDQIAAQLGGLLDSSPGGVMLWRIDDAGTDPLQAQRLFLVSRHWPNKGDSEQLLAYSA